MAVPWEDVKPASLGGEGRALSVPRADLKRQCLQGACNPALECWCPVQIEKWWPRTQYRAGPPSWSWREAGTSSVSVHGAAMPRLFSFLGGFQCRWGHQEGRRTLKVTGDGGTEEPEVTCMGHRHAHRRRALGVAAGRADLSSARSEPRSGRCGRLGELSVNSGAHRVTSPLQEGLPDQWICRR